jgi:hypothetical protein
MKKKVRNILTVTLLYLDPEVVFHTNDVTLSDVMVPCENDFRVLMGKRHCEVIIFLKMFFIAGFTVHKSDSVLQVEITSLKCLPKYGL